MKLTTVLFDLDGTLLPMDQEKFIRGYFGALIRKFAPLGYDPERMQRALMAGIEAMIKNDGRITNEEVFWNTFAEAFPNALADKVHFEAFYRNEFQGVKNCCGFNAQSASAVQEIKEMGLRVILATNPLFPAVATQSRIRWAGLEPEDFKWVTTYENSSFCKPNPAYYEQILAHLGVSAQECLMVGNDLEEDMIARKLGMKVFLLTDCLINRKREDIEQYPNGGLDELMTYITELVTN